MSEAGGPEDTPMALWPAVQVVDGAAEALALLHGKLPLAIATNATVSNRPMIELALRRGGLDSYFNQIFCYTELGYRKEQAEFWLAVQAELGVPLEHLAMVGDSYDQDAMYPRAYGVQAVWFNPSGEPRAGGIAPPIVTRLSQFASWVVNAT